MRVQFSPWQTYSISGSNCKTGEDEAIKPAKKRKGRTSLQEDCKDAVAMSLCTTTTSRKKKQNASFQPVVCVTRSHSVFLLGDNTNEKHSTNDHNEEQPTFSSQNHYQDENHSTQLTVPNNKTWTSKPGLSHSFVPEEQQNHSQGRVAIVPAVFSSSHTNNSNFFAAFQHNNTTVCLWDAKVGPCEDDDDNIQRLKLPNHLFGTSLQFVWHPNNCLFLIGTINDGSIFLLDCNAATKELQIIASNDSSNKGWVSEETFLHCMTSISNDEDFLQVHLLSKATEGKVKRTCLVIRTFSIYLSPIAQDDRTTRGKWIRTNVVPLTLSSSDDTLGDKAIETKALHLQLYSACTLERGSTVAILMQLVSTKHFYIHVVDVTNGALVDGDPIAIPSFYEADPCHHSDNKSNINGTLSMGCVTPDHIVLVSNHLLAVLDRRYNGSIIYQTSVMQIFGEKSTPTSVMKIVQSDSSSHSLILSLTDKTNDSISMAYSTFSSSDKERITMASALASAIATSAIFSTTTFSKETTTSVKCQVTIRCEKHIAYLKSHCDDFLQSKVTTRNGTVAFTWDSLFEEAMLDVYQAIRETQAMPSKAADGEEIQCHTMMNGSLPVAYHKDEAKSREEAQYDPRLQDLLLYAAEGSTRILIHEFLQGEPKKKLSTLANGKQNITANTRSANMSNSANAKAAINVFLKCCSLTQISIRQLNSIVSADTKNNCKSVVQFLCRAGLIHLLHFVLGNCIEASERDLVYALRYMLCSATLDDLITFYLSLDDGFCDGSVLCNGTGKEMLQGHKNTQLASAGNEERTSLPATYGDDLLLRKLIMCSKQFTKANDHLTSSSSKIVSKIIQDSSLFWSRFIVRKCATGLNPSLLRSAIIQCLIMSSKGVVQRDNLEIILLSMTHLLREVVAGRLDLLPLSSREFPPRAQHRIIEWIEALLDAIQFCSVTASSEDSFGSSRDCHSLSQVQLILTAVLAQVQKLMLVENVVSLSMASLCRGVKRRQGELTDGEMVTTKSRDSASKTIPLYSIERLQF